MSDTPSSLPRRLAAIVGRFGRTTDPRMRALEQTLANWARGDEPPRYEATWQALVARVLTQPHWLSLLFPHKEAEFPEFLPLIQSLSSISRVPGPRGADALNARTTWIREQSDLGDPGSLISSLLRDLQENDPAAGPSFQFLSRYYGLLDLLVAHFVGPDLQPLHDRIFTTLHLQRTHWPHSYCSGYLYQGWEELGLCGIKPTGERLRGYDIVSTLSRTDRVLDLGANNGFLSLALSRHVAQVDAVELNPFLIDIGRSSAQHLGRNNVRFILADIESWTPEGPYDAVFSLANHSTIDQRMKMDFETYIAKLFAALKPGGWLFFESHNVFGPGTGGPGDDGDLDLKFDIVERYFELIDTGMHRTFVPAHDIDKLFVKLRRRASHAPDATRRFALDRARTHYVD